MWLRPLLIVTGDRWNVTCDTWHMTHDTWNVTHDAWHLPTKHDIWHMTHDIFFISFLSVSVHFGIGATIRTCSEIQRQQIFFFILVILRHIWKYGQIKDQNGHDHDEYYLWQKVTLSLSINLKPTKKYSEISKQYATRIQPPRNKQF